MKELVLITALVILVIMQDVCLKNFPSHNSFIYSVPSSHSHPKHSLHMYYLNKQNTDRETYNECPLKKRMLYLTVISITTSQVLQTHN